MRLETGLGGTRRLIDASLEWWEEKINENKDYAKFRNTYLSIFDEKYAILFRDSVAIGDQTMTPLQFQNNSNPNEENMEGKGDSDEINLDDDDPIFPKLNFSYPTGDKYYAVDVGYPNTRGWALLRDMHINYKYKNQVRIVISSMAIHNYIRKVGRFDEAFNRAQESYNPVRGGTSSEVYEEGPSTRRTSDDDSYMAAT
ncbi:unnamed protein product [Lactuca virosa]|uniref:DDE Tnp4 domain-containing protein n=1 Tax=Lactuca virosa TaxID=75947 RepID=A0AAU9MFU2_9ASTR|nr:unnamed protein product [Lactuca virosa]